MSLDVTAGGALERRLVLQARVREASHSIFETNRSADRLRAEIRNYLARASDQRLIAEGRDEVRRLVVLSPAPPELADATHSIATPGPRNFHRDPTLPHFTRVNDGAVFDFQISVQESGRQLFLLAYGFELRLPPGSPLPFLRYDLSPPRHKNTNSGLRSHMHLGSDDDGFSVPAPMLSPFEVFDLFLHLVCAGGRRRSST